VINHIDLGTVLRRTVCDLYSDLVTRSTGAAVRTGIEQQLVELQDRTLTVIDFTHVGLLDFSCADEIVAKLLLRYCTPAGAEGVGDPEARPDAYFVFRGIGDAHRDAIDAVLLRHGLALVAEADDGSTVLLGIVGEDESRLWSAVNRLGRTSVEELSRETGLRDADVEALLGRLARRRLLMRLEGEYLAVGAPA
jgi:hypothetical protein